jgi:hexokinase
MELCGAGKMMIKKLHKVSLKDAGGAYDYTAATVHVNELFEFIARQVAMIASGQKQLLGHSFSYASAQTSLGNANFVGWTKEIKVAGLAGQNINELLSSALIQQKLANIHPVAVLNDTTATLLAAAYAVPEADMGSVCGTGHNTCYYESHPRHGDPSQVMAYNAESGGFDRLPFSVFDEELDADSEYPGRQRLEKMVAGRYLGELTRRILWAGRGECGMSFLEECEVFRREDGLSSVDVAIFVGDGTANLDAIDSWLKMRMPEVPVELSERYFIKAVADMVTGRSAALIAASYAGFLRRMDPERKRKHVVGINGSLYEKMPGFAAGIQAALEKQGGWNPGQVSFFVVNEAPLVGAAIAAAMAKEGGAA